MQKSAMLVMFAGAILAGCAAEHPGATSGTTPQVAAQTASPVSSAPPALGEEIDGEAYLNLVRGNTIVGRTERSSDYWIFVSEDGSQRMLWRGPTSTGRDQGQIVARGGRPCTRWRTTWGGREVCGRVFRDGNTIHWVNPDTGKVESSYSIVPGNPQGL
jgi:hypothetical protein